ncbi:MAG: 3-oxoacyl-ACP synthase [Bacteroidota bacterium]
MLPLKQLAHSFCKKYIQKRTERIHSEIEKINESLQSETKSTAGDKHETGRAMLQLEREKLGNQLYEVEKAAIALKKIALERESNRVVLGSLVKTDRAMYFISISAGKLEVGDEAIYCISSSTPMGQLLLGKMKGETFIFNGTNATIRQIE